MVEKIKFGIFGGNEVEIDDDGYIDIPVIIQESGLFAGAPPAELRICHMCHYGDDDFNKAFVAKLNRCTDLPFYLTTAKIKIVGERKSFKDADLKELNIEPLPLK